MKPTDPAAKPRDVAVLIDEHYNARALEDMVVIFENAANQVWGGLGGWRWRSLLPGFCGNETTLSGIGKERTARTRWTCGPGRLAEGQTLAPSPQPPRQRAQRAPAAQDEHPTGFMCNGALLARPLSPMRHALAATLQYLGGALPPHLGYHPQ